MKYIRNWTAHNLLENDISENFVTFNFLIAMRALLKTDINSTFLVICKTSCGKVID